MNVINYRANEAFYFAAVWAISFSGGLASYFFLSAANFSTVASLLAFGMMTIAFLKYASTKRLHEKVYSFSRTNPVIVADILIEAIKMTMLSIILDAGAKGVTLENIVNGSPRVGIVQEQWDGTRFIVLVCIMIFIYWTCVCYIYPTQAQLERNAT